MTRILTRVWRRAVRDTGPSLLFSAALLFLRVPCAVIARGQVPDTGFVLIKPGTFQMGDAGNGPTHTVTLTRAFWLQRTEVTQAQWLAVMGSNPSRFRQCGSACPVENVSYDAVQAFIIELNARSPGKKYRLPTEAEWEYAARAGTTGEFGTPGAMTQGGWIAANSGGITHAVGQLRPNGWGLYDMEGNVWEWVADWFGPYPSDPATDPTGPAAGDYRVLRGGSWFFSAPFSTSAHRSSVAPATLHSLGGVGFRLAKTP